MRDKTLPIDVIEELADRAYEIGELKRQLLGERSRVAVTEQRILELEQQLEAERAKVARYETVPVAWMYQDLINKHVTGDPKPGQIQIGIVWGDIGSFHVSLGEPKGYIVRKIPLYSQEALAALQSPGMQP